jgi:hypothetical protein
MNRHEARKCAALQGEACTVLCPEPIYAEVVYDIPGGAVPVYYCERHFCELRVPVAAPPRYRLVA